MLATVVSRADEASERVGEGLLEVADWETRYDDSRPDRAGGGDYHVLPAGETTPVAAGAARGPERVELRTFDDLHLHLPDAATAFGAGVESPSDERPALLAFASRHSGETGPLLTAHFTGNVGQAEYGGEAGELATAAPGALSRAVETLDRHAPEEYEVGIECTHHGPSRVGCPSLFVEVGSAKPQWRDPDAAGAVAQAILSLRGVDPWGDRAVVGLGGGHYAPRFERVLRETAWAVGHVVADWGLSDVDPETSEGRAVLRAVFERSGVERALVDGDYPKVRTAVETLGYETVSESWLRAVDDRPLDVVETVEDCLGRVADGVALGGRTTTDVAVAELPADLIAEAQGVDPEGTWAVVERETVAVETVEGGSRVGGRAALPRVAPETTTYDDVVDGLAALLTAKYDSVERDGDTVVARRRAFDPALAREAGVPEGPAFGRLADGETVEVGGETVTPEEVHRERRREFEV